MCTLYWVIHNSIIVLYWDSMLDSLFSDISLSSTEANTNYESEDQERKKTAKKKTKKLGSTVRVEAATAASNRCTTVALRTELRRLDFAEAERLLGLSKWSLKSSKQQSLGAAPLFGRPQCDLSNILYMASCSSYLTLLLGPHSGINQSTQCIFWLNKHRRKYVKVKQVFLEERNLRFSLSYTCPNKMSWLLIDTLSK